MCAGERHISTGMIAKRRRMATAVHAAGSARLFVLSHSLASAQGDDVFYSCGGFTPPDARIGGVDCRVQLLRPHLALAGCSIRRTLLLRAAQPAAHRFRRSALAGCSTCRAQLIRRLLQPLICRRLCACPPVELFGTCFIYFARFAVRNGGAISKGTIDKIKSA